MPARPTCSRFRRLLLLGCLSFALGCGTAIADDAEAYDPSVWRDRNGTAIEAELAAAWGPYAFFRFADGRTVFFPINGLDAFSRERLKRRVAGQQAGSADGPGSFGRFVAEHRVHLAEDGYLRPDPGAGAEGEHPEFYLLALAPAETAAGRQLMEHLSRLQAEWRSRNWDACDIVWVSRDRMNRQTQRVFRDLEPGIGALRFGHRFHHELELLDYGVYPVLALVDRNGNLLFHSVRGRAIEPHHKLLERLDRILPYADDSALARLGG